METTQIITALLGPFRIIAFYFALMNTLILMRNLLHLHAVIVIKQPVEMSAWLIRIPVMWWTVFATTYFINFI